jgi:WG containing repeat
MQAFSTKKPLFKIREHGRYGFIDASGEVVIEPQYLETGDFQHGFTRARLNDRWAPLDALGRLLLKRSYRQIGPFCDGLMRVQVVQRWGYIDRRGNEMIQPNFDHLIASPQSVFPAIGGISIPMGILL